MKSFCIFLLTFFLSSNFLFAEINPGGVGSPASFPSGFSGVTDGSAAGAGEVGEEITASISSDFVSSSTATDVWVDVTSLNVTLPAGSWLIMCDGIAGRWDSGLVTGNFHGMVVGLRNSGDTVIASGVSPNYVQGANDAWASSISTKVDISAGETYKISLLSHSFGGAADSGNKVLRVWADQGISGSTVLRAIRIR